MREPAALCPLPPPTPRAACQRQPRSAAGAGSLALHTHATQPGPALTLNQHIQAPLQRSQFPIRKMPHEWTTLGAPANAGPKTSWLTCAGSGQSVSQGVSRHRHDPRAPRRRPWASSGVRQGPLPAIGGPFSPPCPASPVLPCSPASTTSLPSIASKNLSEPAPPDLASWVFITPPPDQAPPCSSRPATPCAARGHVCERGFSPAGHRKPDPAITPGEHRLYPPPPARQPRL